MRVIGVLLIIISLGIFEKPALARKAPQTQEIIHVIRQFREVDPSQGQIKSLSKSFRENPDKVTFLPVNVLGSAQHRISFDRVQTKILDLYEDYGAESLRFDNHKSFLPDTAPVKIVLLPDGIAVVDGNHETLASIYVGAKTIPTIVVADYSNRSSNEVALREMEKDGLAYMKKLNGKTDYKLVLLSDLVDDPNRFLLSVVSRRVKVIQIDGEAKLESHASGHDVIVKFEEGTPFIEFICADILYENGIVYDPTWGENIPKKVIKQIRKILIKAKADGDPRLQQTAFIAHSTPAKHLFDDPNVHAVELMTQTIITKKDGKKFKDTEGPKYPIAIVLDVHHSNSRVAMAAALYRKGYVYDWKDGDDIPDEFREESREALIEEKKTHPEDLKNIAVVKKAVPRKEIDSEKIFTSIQQKAQTCTKLLSL
jgi:hypothetical protein